MHPDIDKHTAAKFAIGELVTHKGREYIVRGRTMVLHGETVEGRAVYVWRYTLETWPEQRMVARTVRESELVGLDIEDGLLYDGETAEPEPPREPSVDPAIGLRLLMGGGSS